MAKKVNRKQKGRPSWTSPSLTPLVRHLRDPIGTQPYNPFVEASRKSYIYFIANLLKLSTNSQIVKQRLLDSYVSNIGKKGKKWDTDNLIT